MKGYKVFNSDWTCRGFKYEVGKTYEIDDYPILCRRGFHFCTNPIDCFKHYNIWDDVKIAKVEALGEIKGNCASWADSKRCTNKIKIVRELSLEKAKIETTIMKIPSAFYLLFRSYAPFRPSKNIDDKYIICEVIKSIEFLEEKQNERL